MESISCIFGHGASNEVVIEENGYQGRRCPVCKIIYVSPRPKADQVLELYQSDQAHVASIQHIHYDPGGEFAAKAHFKAIYGEHPFYHSAGEKPLSILEIGAGGGRFLNIAKKAGLETFGVELNPELASYIEKELGIPCERQPFSRNSFGDRKFDIIFHCNVASHFHDPIQEFTVMFDKLAPNGQLIFETGNGADIDPSYYKYFNCWQYPDHLFFFGEDSVRELLRRAGFKKIHILSWSILPELIFDRFVWSRGRRAVDPSVPASAPTKSGKLSRKKKALRLGAAHLRHFFRFTLGALSSNKRVPRTMLIWAMK